MGAAAATTTATTGGCATCSAGTTGTGYRGASGSDNRKGIAVPTGATIAATRAGATSGARLTVAADNAEGPTEQSATTTGCTTGTADPRSSSRTSGTTGTAVGISQIAFGTAAAVTATATATTSATVAAVGEQEPGRVTALATGTASTAAVLSVLAVSDTVAVVRIPPAITPIRADDPVATGTTVPADPEEQARRLPAVTAVAGGCSTTGRGATATTRTADTHHPAARTARTAIGTRTTGATGTAVAEHARIAAVTASHPISRTAIALAAVTEQQTTVGAVGIGRGAIVTVADQIDPGHLVDDPCGRAPDRVDHPNLLTDLVHRVVHEPMHDVGLVDPGVTQQRRRRRRRCRRRREEPRLRRTRLLSISIGIDRVNRVVRRQQHGHR